MKIRRLAFQLTGLVLFTGIASIHAQDNNPWLAKDSINNSSNSRLTVSPSVCVIETIGESCKQTLNLYFKTERKQHVCIYKTNTIKPIWCGKLVDETRLTLEVNSDQNTILTARNQDNNDILATAIFSLKTYQPVKKRKRRRYGLGII